MESGSSLIETTINTTLQTFISAGNATINNLQVFVTGLITSMLVIEIVMFGIRWASEQSQDMYRVVRKLFFLGLVLWIANNYITIRDDIRNGFELLGVIASKNQDTGKGFMQNPSQVIKIYMDQILAPIVEQTKQASWFSVSGYGLIAIALLILFAYLIITLQIFITQVEFSLLSSLIFAFIPFGCFSGTRFLMEKIFSLFISFGVKFYVLCFLMGFLQKPIQSIAIGEQVSTNDVVGVFAVSCVFALLAVRVPAVAAGLLAGAPSLGDVAASITSAATSTVSSFAAGAANSLVSNSGGRSQSSNTSQSSGGSSTSSSSVKSALSNGGASSQGGMSSFGSTGSGGTSMGGGGNGTSGNSMNSPGSGQKSPGSNTPGANSSSPLSGGQMASSFMQSALKGGASAAVSGIKKAGGALAAGTASAARTVGNEARGMALREASPVGAIHVPLDKD